VLIGGGGQKRTPRLAARYAAEFNLPFATAEATAAAFGRVQEACATAGRAPDSMIYSVAQTVACGRTPEDVARRATAIGRDPEQLRAQGLAGSPAEIADKIGSFAEIGAETLYLQVLDLDDLDHLELLAELIP
jgi:alkanesulfonate monooxygenase SsuD/methylene tetrahydromethanopterin reductase-like flavin-dependent oxidoreductase (luciferase family)